MVYGRENDVCCVVCSVHKASRASEKRQRLRTGMVNVLAWAQSPQISHRSALSSHPSAANVEGGMLSTLVRKIITVPNVIPNG